LRFFKVIVVCFAAVISLPLQAKRVALVMGNDNYTAVSKLQKAGNDAAAMARELKNAGFTVQLHKDLNYRGMVRAVEAFTNNITGGDEVVVFFAGHGVQIKSGSYLLPTDIEANSESEVEKTAYELLALTDKISEAKPAFSLVMVDACRDNPLKSRGRSIGNARGLSAIEPPKGQMVVYSASRGQQALDRLSDKDPNPNGVFTREFIAQMQKPGVRIEDIMRGVQDSVESLAKTVNHDQRPAVYNEARGNFYFFAPDTAQVAAVQQKPDTNAIELALWESVKSASTVSEIQAYLNRFPNGFFAELARLRISSLNSSSAEKIALENSQRIENERLKEESERKIAKQKIELEAQERLARQKANEEVEKRIAEEKAAKDYADRISLHTAAIERAQKLAAQAETEKNQNKPSELSKPAETSLADNQQIEFNRVIEAARLESMHSRLETEKSVQDFINKNTAGSIFKDCEACPEMVVVPSGNFQMGSRRSFFSSNQPSQDEMPQHRVSIQTFAIGKFEVTQEQWIALMGKNPSRFINLLNPVEQVSWDDAQEFTKKLSAVTGQNYRLPTEAEWEFAARAGTETEFSFGDSVNEHDIFAFSKKNSDGKTNLVGLKKANPFGLHDMYGNVMEWIQDCWKPNYSGAPNDGSANFPNRENCRKVLRGGSWQTNPEFLRSTQRFKFPPEASSDDLGLRVVRELR
jgi:formylglycine-generating enzyme required for sulfatase activity